MSDCVFTSKEDNSIDIVTNILHRSTSLKFNHVTVDKSLKSNTSRLSKCLSCLINIVKDNPSHNELVGFMKRTTQHHFYLKIMTSLTYFEMLD